MWVIQVGGISRLRRFVRSHSNCLKNYLNRQATQAKFDNMTKIHSAVFQL